MVKFEWPYPPWTGEFCQYSVIVFGISLYVQCICTPLSIVFMLSNNKMSRNTLSMSTVLSKSLYIKHCSSSCEHWANRHSAFRWSNLGSNALIKVFMAPILARNIMSMFRTCAVGRGKKVAAHFFWNFALFVYIVLFERAGTCPDPHWLLHSWQFKSKSSLKKYT